MEFVRTALTTLGLYRQARLIRNRYIRPDLGRRVDRWRQLYSQFLSPGDLAFDVGANHGDRTEIFVEMGARVVAVEPIPALAAGLRDIFRHSPVQVEPVGAGSKPGTLPLHICTASECSSFSSEFIEGQRKRNTDFAWDRTETISIVTLDHLIQKHGTPSFIKIDVEGFEAEVLDGLNHAVAGLSFEIRPEDPAGMIERCFERLAGLALYDFNLSVEEKLTFELPQFTDSGSVLKIVQGMQAGSWKYADVYAKRRAS